METCSTRFCFWRDLGESLKNKKNERGSWIYNYMEMMIASTKAVNLCLKKPLCFLVFDLFTVVLVDRMWIYIASMSII